MFEKKKLNFWRLAISFTGLVVITLLLLWSVPQAPKTQMMTDSMGNMMTNMHGKNFTIYDFISNVPAQDMMGEVSSHHEDEASATITLNFLTTSIIFLLLPFIIGGSIILAIVWFR